MLDEQLADGLSSMGYSKWGYNRLAACHEHGSIGLSALIVFINDLDMGIK